MVVGSSTPDSELLRMRRVKAYPQMKRENAAQTRGAHTAIISSAVAAMAVLTFMVSVPSGGATTSQHLVARADSSAARANASTSSTTTTSDTSTSPPVDGLITAGPSRSECVTLNPAATQSGLAYVQSLVSSFDSVTRSTVTCLSVYTGAQTWSGWIHPWVDSTEVGFASWVAQQPQSRQLVVAVNLIPNELENVNNPTKWEKSCATGVYDSYARQLGANLVSAGLENTVIRLGPEMNGVWESDFIGPKKTEQKLWAKCFAKEVTSFRQVAGQHFLFDWNVNACTGNYPYQNFYPGNQFVDIIGLDLYDVGCETPTTRLTFAQLASEPAGLNRFEAFAAAKGKPMSLPEWGLSTIPAGDDPAYINGNGSTFTNEDFAFESYFDGAGGPKSKAMALGPGTPLSDAAFQEWFGTKQ